MSSTLAIFNRLSKWPFGRVLFAKALGFKAPYFATIKPRFQVLERGRCVVGIHDRRAVRNHIGTVHAGALCTLCELVGGLTVDVSLPKGMHWIPTGMTVRYVKKATGPLTAECHIDPGLLSAGGNQVPVQISNADGTIVCKADITFLLRESKKPGAAG